MFGHSCLLDSSKLIITSAATDHIIATIEVRQEYIEVSMLEQPHFMYLNKPYFNMTAIHTTNVMYIDSVA